MKRKRKRGRERRERMRRRKNKEREQGKRGGGRGVVECWWVVGSYLGTGGGVLGVSQEEPLVNETFLRLIVNHTQIKLQTNRHHTQ